MQSSSDGTTVPNIKSHMKINGTPPGNLLYILPLSTEKKRGMKPRSKRSRKRPRSERNALEAEIQPNLQVLPLELDGKAIQANTSWIRTVEPYPYTFSTFVKARWVGRTILDVYSTEFGSYPSSYYESAITQGRILVSDQVVPIDHVIKGNDVLTHTVHRHEPGVAVSLKEEPFVHILQETENVLVVEKPGTLPVHPCGGYHVQSLMNLLEPKFGKLYTIHRLDRLTGGLVILGKTSAVAQEWGKAIMNHSCQKVYLARVKGKFPMNAPKSLPRLLGQKSDLPDRGVFLVETASSPTREAMETEIYKAAQQNNAYGLWVTQGEGTPLSEASMQDVFNSQFNYDDWLSDSTSKKNDLKWLHLACPTRIAQPKDGICEAGAFEHLDEKVYLKSVKPAETSFGVLSYDDESDSTLVICRPQTGRTHQIRLHLQHLGHPIANDPNYGGDIWYGNNEGQEASRVAQTRLNSIAETNQGDIQATTTIDVPATEKEIQQGVVGTKRQDEETIHEYIKRTCVWCSRSRNTTGNTPRDVLEFLVRSPGIWLHAFQYTFKDDQGLHTFRCPPPTWAEHA